MGWASNYIASLKAHQSIRMRPRGHSMSGRIESGQLVTIEPVIDFKLLSVGDIVLCSVNGHQYLHLIKAIKDNRFLIGNNKGGTNGWCGENQIYGKCVKIEP